jgi:hypothetical protein
MNLGAESKKHLSNATRRNIATALLNFEGAVVLALGAFLIIEFFIVDSVEILPLLGVLLFTLIGGLGLLACAYSFKNQRHFGRAPAVLANLIALGVAKYQFEGGLWFIALPLVILALSTIYCAVTIVPESDEK